MAKMKRKDAPSKTATAKSTPATNVPAKPSEPFSFPPPHLEPFYSTLDRNHVYITHVDSQPYTLKRRVFIVPVLMNIAFAGLLLWRLYVAIPTYFAIFIAALGHHSEHKVDIQGTSWNGLMTVIMNRAFLFFMDWSLAKFVLPWPLDFFFGSPSNPVGWRRNVGFRGKEIIVRVSRKWDKAV